MAASDTKELVQFVEDRFSKLENRRKAREMAAYMKTDMPFYGIQKPDRLPVLKALVKRFPPTSPTGYRRSVLALWKLPQREGKYAAIHFACSYPEYIAHPQMRLYQRLIREGAWWDFVDDVATRLVGSALFGARKEVNPILEDWIGHRDMWLRRSAILSHLRHKEHTDEKRLFRHCRARAHEKEFFIRKAIGWALRQYSYTRPEAVRQFLIDEPDSLSGLTRREASKQLARVGLSPF